MRARYLLVAAIFYVCQFTYGGGARAQQKPPEFKKAWVSKTEDWNKEIAVAPWGDVISIASGVLRVHARDSGQILDENKICWIVDNGFGFIDDKTAVLVCEKEVYEVFFPGAALKKALHLQMEPVAAAVGGGHVAVTEEKRAVDVYRIKDWKLADSFKADVKIESLALSHDGGKLAMGSVDGRIFMRDLKTQKTRLFWESGDSTAIGALVFSDDDKKLFGESGTFEACLWDVDKGTQLKNFKTGSWLVRAAFLSPSVIAASGSDGLVLYMNKADPVKTLDYADTTFSPAVEGLDASKDGALVCSGDRDGVIACFSAGKLKPSQYAKLPEAGGAKAAAAQAPAPPPGEILELLGQIKGRKGKVVTVKIYAPPPLPAGTKGTLYKHFEKKLGPLATTGWLEIAAVKVKEVAEDKVLLVIEKEKSVITVNKKKVNNFKAGTKIKLVTAPLP